MEWKLAKVICFASQKVLLIEKLGHFGKRSNSLSDGSFDRKIGAAGSSQLSLA